MPSLIANATTFDESLDVICQERTVWIRFGAVRDGDATWHARMFEMTGGGGPPSWEKRTWEYPNGLFGSLKISGSRATKFLREQKLTYGKNVVTLPQMMTMVQWGGGRVARELHMRLLNGRPQKQRFLR